VGVFLQDIMTPVPQVTITAGVRFDNWRNYDAHNLETNVPAGTPTPNNNPNLPERSDSVASPRLAAMYQHYRPRERLGRPELRVPRAHVERALTGSSGSGPSSRRRTSTSDRSVSPVVKRASAWCR
jgi:hypothetical protein